MGLNNCLNNTALERQAWNPKRPPVTLTTGGQLRACAQFIRGGWCQCRLVDDDGRVCAMGAIVCVADQQQRAASFCDTEHHAETVTRLARALIEHGLRPLGLAIPPGRSYLAIVSAWNDRAGQTAEAVARVFEVAATVSDDQGNIDDPDDPHDSHPSSNAAV